MEYSYLGSSGLRVSNICLGTRSFGKRPDGPPHCLTEEQSHGILDEFASAGGNFIDTAGSYGLPEEYLGNWLCKHERDDVIVATKIRYGLYPFQASRNPNLDGLSRPAIIRAVDCSLQRLRTDYLDLLQMHCWDFGTPIEETLSTFNDLIRQGKVRYLGASNLTGWQLQKIADVSRERGWEPFVSLQQQWNLLSRGTEYECVDVCRNEGVAILPWSPLMGGWLTGKFKRGMTTADLSADTRVGWVNQDPYARTTYSHIPYDEMASDDRTWRVLEALNGVAMETGRKCSQVALRWLLQKDVVPSVVIGVTSSQQLHDNIGAVGWQLTEQQMSTLDDASATGLPYPYNLNRFSNATRMRKSHLK